MLENNKRGMTNLDLRTFHHPAVMRTACALFCTHRSNAQSFAQQTPDRTVSVPIPRRSLYSSHTSFGGSSSSDILFKVTHNVTMVFQPGDAEASMTSQSEAPQATMASQSDAPQASVAPPAGEPAPAPQETARADGVHPGVDEHENSKTRL